LTWDRLKHGVVRDHIDDLFLGPAGDARPSLGTLVRAVLKSAQINEGKGESLLGLRKLLATDTRRDYDEGTIGRPEYLQIVTSLEHTASTSARSYETALTPHELGSRFVKSVGLDVEVGQSESGESSTEEDRGRESRDGIDDGNDDDKDEMEGSKDDEEDGSGDDEEEEMAYNPDKRCRVGWTEGEKKALREGVQLWGNQWETILKSRRFRDVWHPKRTAVNLKDAHRQYHGVRQRKNRKNQPPTKSFLESVFSKVKAFCFSHS
jgi:hypothetical protein